MDGIMYGSAFLDLQVSSLQRPFHQRFCHIAIELNCGLRRVLILCPVISGFDLVGYWRYFLNDSRVERCVR